MRTTTKKLLGALTVAGIVATGGTAYTAAITINKPVQALGAGAQSIQGSATASSIDYVLSGDGQTVTNVEVTLVGDQTSKLVESSFQGATRTACSLDGTTSSGGETPTVTATTFLCGGAPTATATSFSLLVTDAVDSNVSRVS